MIRIIIQKALPSKQLQEPVALARSGMTKAELVRSYGISRETVYQYMRSSARERNSLRYAIGSTAAVIPRMHGLAVLLNNSTKRPRHATVARRGRRRV